MFNKTLTLALLLGCMSLLQVHSIEFWTKNVDATTGWAWSLLLEGAALMLWSSAQWQRRALGAVATVLLLAGPLYQVSSPLVKEWQANERTPAVNAERKALLAAEIADLSKSAAIYDENSEDRRGWDKLIVSTQSTLAERRAELHELLKAEATPEQRMTWQAQVVIVMQALALMLLQLVGVLCIGDLRSTATAKTGEPVGAASGDRRRPSLAIVRNPRPRGTMA